MGNVQKMQTPTRGYDGLAALLDRWEAIPAQPLAIRDIETLPELQPRNMSAIRTATAKLDQRRRLVELVETLTGYLKVAPAADARPVLVAKVDDRLLLVDGHHRLKAYRAARRHEIPARVVPTVLARAIAASRLANVRGSTVALHRDETKEAVWDFLSQLLRHGQREWREAMADGYSYEKVRTLFHAQISTDTIRRMAEAGPVARKLGYTSEHWPSWAELNAERRKDKITEEEHPEDDDETAERLAFEWVEASKWAPTGVFLRALERAKEIRSELEAVDAEQGGIPELETYDPDDPESVY